MVKTRFAPSPTGYLHIGGARTALFNYIYAKHYAGKFILRIEDTDYERSLKKYEEDIIKSLEWLGLVSDEPASYQSSRLDIYKEYCQKLLDEGKAYNCYCSVELLEEDKNKLVAESKKPMYSGRCRNLPPDKQNNALPHVVRFKTHREDGHLTKFKDLTRDQFVSVNNNEIDDFVIMRTDGIPTYNFAVVIDDALMGITHIIRGDDHLSNTPKQVLLYEALGFKPPEFAHVSMILGNDGKRLSKRHGATAVMQYKNDGFLPEALINYLVRLGWSHGNDEILSIADMIKYFDLKHISKSAAVFNKEKLLWLNAHYIKQKTAKELVDMINDIDIDNKKDKKIAYSENTSILIDALKPRVKTLIEIKEKMGFYLNDGNIIYDKNLLSEIDKFKLNEFDNSEHGEKLSKFKLNEHDNSDNNSGYAVKHNDIQDNSFNSLNNAIFFLNTLINFIENLNLDSQSFNGAGYINYIKESFNEFFLKNKWSLKEKAMIIRIALTGEKISPGIYEVIFALGKKRTLQRIYNFIEFLKTNYNQ
ncbi:MAG: glutamate--tRNA ligase [Deltaproteobacteria bacterium]|nr:glutamate--tRNA ligase [Deltaproteobacteria bacterium]